MTDLDKAIAEVTNLANVSAWDADDFETFSRGRATAIATILNAVAFGALVPATDAETLPVDPKAK